MVSTRRTLNKDSSNVVNSSKQTKNVPSVENILEAIQNTEKVSSEAIIEKKKHVKSTEKQMEEQKKMPRGIAKSGRMWKTPKQKFRSIQNSLPKYSLDKLQKRREEMRKIKEISRGIKEERKQENELKRQRREENAKRRLENDRKSETVQIIKNSAKIKRMKKKQLRSIEKRDLSTVKVV